MPLSIANQVRMAPIPLKKIKTLQKTMSKANFKTSLEDKWLNWPNSSMVANSFRNYLLEPPRIL
jgi:hypothetical protein